eukprot:ANDGO_00112.mRNA.1 hypothetical protein
MSCPFGYKSADGSNPHLKAGSASSSTATTATTAENSEFSMGSCPIKRSGGLDIEIVFPPYKTSVPIKNLLPELTPPDLISLLKVTKAVPTLSPSSSSSPSAGMVAGGLSLDDPSKVEVVHKPSNTVIGESQRLKTIVQSGDVLIVRMKKDDSAQRNVRLYLDKNHIRDFAAVVQSTFVKDLVLAALLDRSIQLPKCKMEDLVFRYRGKNLDIAAARVSELEDEEECLISMYCFAESDAARKRDSIWTGVYLVSLVVFAAAVAVMYAMVSTHEVPFMGKREL